MGGRAMRKEKETEGIKGDGLELQGCQSVFPEKIKEKLSILKGREVGGVEG